MKDDTYVVVIGAGRVGRAVATRLSRAGWSVVVVDRDEASLGRLPAEYTGFRVLGNASDLATLREAELERAGSVFALTENDNLNLMIAQAARALFEVPRVRARVSDVSRAELYERLGVAVVNPTALAADALLDDLSGGRP